MDKFVVRIRYGKRLKVNDRSSENRPEWLQVPHEAWAKDWELSDRDSMKAKAYAAENEVWARRPSDVRFPRLSTAARYLRRLISSKWFQRRWPHIDQVTLELLTLGSHSRGGGRWIGFLKSHMNEPYSEWILLHELAHAICPSRERHGRLWARTYVELVRLKIGKDASRDLRSTFADHGVITRSLPKPGTRKGNPEALIKARAVLRQK